MLEKHAPLFLLPLLLLSTPVSVLAAYYLATPAGAQQMGVAARLGPYSTKAPCDLSGSSGILVSETTDTFGTTVRVPVGGTVRGPAPIDAAGASRWWESD